MAHCLILIIDDSQLIKQIERVKMKILLEVSNKMFSKDIEDHFRDFWYRVIANITDTLNNDEGYSLCGRYELETATLLKRAFEKGVYDYND